MGTTGKGFAFSLDLAIAFIAMLLMLSLMLAKLDSDKKDNLQDLEKIALQEKATFIADAIVKNRDEKNPLAGSAVFDAEKHRVLQNQLDLRLLSKAKPTQVGKYIVSNLSITANGEKLEIFSNKTGKNCMAIDRIILINGTTAKLEVTTCAN